MEFFFDSCRDEEELKWKCNPFKVNWKPPKFCQVRVYITGKVEAGCFMGSEMSHPGIIISLQKTLFKTNGLPSVSENKRSGSKERKIVRVKEGMWKSSKEQANLRSCPGIAALSLQANHYDLCYRYILWLCIVMGQDSAASFEGHYNALRYLLFVQPEHQLRSVCSKVCGRYTQGLGYM